MQHRQKSMPCGRGGSVTRSNYVPASTSVTETVAPITNAEVAAVWRQNLGAGVGATVLVACGWYTFHGFMHRMAWWAQPWPEPAAVALGTVLVGGAVFGALMVVRFALDEVMDGMDFLDLDRALEATAAERDELADRLAQVEEDYRILQSEYRLVVSKIGQTAAARQVYVSPAAQDTVTGDNDVDPTVKRDAITLIDRALTGKAWGRDAMRDNGGWGQTRWEKARDLLVIAKVVTYQGKTPVLVTDDKARALAMLEGARVRVAEARSIVSGTGNNVPTLEVD